MGLNVLPNIVKKKKKERSEKEGITVSFLFFSFIWLVFFFITPWALQLLEIPSYKGKKKTQGSREEPPISKVGFFKLCYLFSSTTILWTKKYILPLASKSLAIIYKKMGVEFWVPYFGVQTIIHRLKSMGCCLVMNMLIVDIIVLRFFTFSG